MFIHSYHRKLLVSYFGVVAVSSFFMFALNVALIRPRIRQQEYEHSRNVLGHVVDATEMYVEETWASIYHELKRTESTLLVYNERGAPIIRSGQIADNNEATELIGKLLFSGGDWERPHTLNLGTMQSAVTAVAMQNTKWVFADVSRIDHLYATSRTIVVPITSPIMC